MDQLNSEIEKIRKELETKPEDDALWNDLGVGLFLTGKYYESVEMLKKAVSISPDSAVYHFNLANSYVEANQPETAIHHYMQCLESDPNHIAALTNMADTYEATGNDKKAHEIFTYITRVNPDDALAHFNLGNFFLRHNQHIEAAKCYEECLKREGDFADAWYNIAWILSQTKAKDKAKEYAEKGLQADPDHEDLQELLKSL
jgi:tetratricopeptide (TPR) repeat protein